MAIAKVFYMAAVLVMCKISCEANMYPGEQRRESSVSGMMLQRHVYRQIIGAEMGHICLQECYRDVRCQSFNYVISQSMCELNDRTKEARPEDFVPDSDRYYFRRDWNIVPLGSIPSVPAESCKEIKASEGGQAVSRRYWFRSIVPNDVVSVHCDMETEDVNECTSTIPVCDVNAKCKNTIGSYICSCNKAGFTGDGKRCSDINECSTSAANCDVNADCQNTPGSFLCSCKTGFTGDGKTCTDVNECGSSIPFCDVNSTCQNIPGSYLCSCKAGFTGDGKTCTDIDECAGNSHGCNENAYCNNTVGSYICRCKATYYGNGKNCTSHRGLGASVILGSLDHKKYSEKLISYLDPVLLSSERSGFVRCWHAKTDGSAASTFHTNCDGKGPTVTIIKVGSYIFGAYTDVSWVKSPCDYSPARKAFIFSLNNAKGYNPVMLAQYKNQQSAMYRCNTNGPTFGAGNGHDIFISNNATNNQDSYTKCGHTYSNPPGYSTDNCRFFTGALYFTPTDIEVFYEIGELGASVILGSLDHSKYLGKLISYLDPVIPSASRSEFVRCWHAKTDGSAASTFHTNCDGKGPTVTIIKVGSYIFGGYTDVSWIKSPCGWSSASKAFIFSFYNAKGYNSVKLTQYQNQHLAMYRCNSYGPTFGSGYDLLISNDAINNQGSYTKCGGTYSNPPGYSTGDCGFFTGALYFTPDDIEVFYKIGGLGASVILGSLDHSKYLGKLISYLDPVIPSASRSEFVRCWHAKTDGWAASTFHTNCDGKGPTVTIIKVGSYIFGGYTDVSWIKSPCAYSSASKAFLFSFYNAKGYNPVKLTQYQNQQSAMYRCSSYGPIFGAGHDIHIRDDAINNQDSYTYCGHTYSNPPGYSTGDCGFFTGALHFTPTDIEVFYEIGGLGASVILGSLDHSKYLGKLISYLDPVIPSASRSEFVRCWHAKTDGWAASTFHTNCDGKGPTVTIIKVGSYIFGGYTDVSWIKSSCGYSPASKAFLFSFYNTKGYNPVKLTQYQNQQSAMYRCNSYGPTFGYGHDLRIWNDAINNQNSYTKCGYTYSNPPGYSTGDCGFFTGAFRFTPTDIEVFYEIGLGASVILGDLDHSKYIEQLFSYLDPVLLNSERSRFVRCWHAKTDGWAVSTFHTNCDGKGPTVTIIKVGNYIFGGYTNVNWHNSCAWSSANKAFLFSLYNAKGYNPVKLTQYRYQQNAMYSCNSYGPTFGSGHDLRIWDDAINNQNSYTECGGTYSNPPGYSAGNCGFFTGARYFTPTDIEVFYEIGN